MILVKRRTLRWAEENLQSPKFTLEASTFIWTVESKGTLAFTCGLIRPSLLGFAEFWIVPAAMQLHVLRQVKEMTRELRRYAAKVSIHVNKPRDRRFAELFGFQFVGEEVVDGKIWVRGEL